MLFDPNKKLALDMLKDDKSFYWIVKGIGKILAMELRRLTQSTIILLKERMIKRASYVFYGKVS